MLAFDTNLAPIVGQQMTLDQPRTAAVVGARIDLLIARGRGGRVRPRGEGRPRRRSSAAGCAPRRRAPSGAIAPASRCSPTRSCARSPRQRRAGADLHLRAAGLAATRIGVDRDEDGFFDRDELDAGTDPADPSSIPAGGTTTTSTTTPGGTTTTSTTLPQVTLVQTTALKLTDELDPPGFGKLSFSSSTRKDPTPHRIFVPAPGGPSDPRLTGVLLRYYNSGGLTGDSQLRALAPEGWTLLGSTASPKGYRYRGKDVGDTLTKSATIKADSIRVKGFSVYSLDEPAQGRVAVEMSSGLATWCADAPAKASGNPPSTANNDHPGKFTAQPKTPAPIACPGRPGSPSGAFVLDAEG